MWRCGRLVPPLACALLLVGRALASHVPASSAEVAGGPAANASASPLVCLHTPLMTPPPRQVFTLSLASGSKPCGLHAQRTVLRHSPIMYPRPEELARLGCEPLPGRVVYHPALAQRYVFVQAFVAAERKCSARDVLLQVSLLSSGQPRPAGNRRLLHTSSNVPAPLPAFFDGVSVETGHNVSCCCTAPPYGHCCCGDLSCCYENMEGCSSTCIAVVGVLVAVLFVCMAMLPAAVRFARNRHRPLARRAARADGVLGPPVRCTASTAAIVAQLDAAALKGAALPAEQFFGGADALQCPVCLDPCADVCCWRRFACGHGLCAGCLHEIAARLENAAAATCPICRRALLPSAKGAPDADADEAAAAPPLPPSVDPAAARARPWSLHNALRALGAPWRRAAPPSAAAVAPAVLDGRSTPAADGVGSSSSSSSSREVAA